jgi:hypothetical protein
MAGREADFGGRWTEPCPEIGRNLIASEGPELPTIHLCDGHFKEVNEAGMIAEAYLGAGEAGRDEFERRHGWRPPS